ncbi:MAG: CxxC-x17-CxxC domain-containing protein [Promethearchaeota archaeon]
MSNRGHGNRSNRGYSNRTMHKATCADCGNECEVPFKPAEGRDVYCRECYKKHRKY